MATANLLGGRPTARCCPNVSDSLESKFSAPCSLRHAGCWLDSWKSLLTLHFLSCPTYRRCPALPRMRGKIYSFLFVHTRMAIGHLYSYVPQCTFVCDEREPRLDGVVAGNHTSDCRLLEISWKDICSQCQQRSCGSNFINSTNGLQHSNINWCPPRFDLTVQVLWSRL
jgi:hypothetical protein